MKVIDTAIPDVKIIEPTVFGDARGFFYESFNQARFNQVVGRDVKFVQDNHSKSRRGVLRGLHYQLAPHAQGKLVRCTSGEVFDVAVDIRPESPTCGQWVSAILSAENKRQMWVPEGFAHGFLVLSEEAEFLYKTPDYWFKELERAIHWADPTLAIAWPDAVEILLSDKDAQAPVFASALAQVE